MGLSKLCIECGHPIGWHYKAIEENDRYGSEKLPENSPCQWDTASSNPLHDCKCAGFIYPELPRRREAIEHTRRKLGL